jgi:hypothetical protein
MSFPMQKIAKDDHFRFSSMFSMFWLIFTVADRVLVAGMNTMR